MAVITETAQVNSMHAEMAGRCLKLIQQSNMSPYDAQAVISLMALYLTESMDLDARAFANALHHNLVYMGSSPQGAAARIEFLNLINTHVSTTRVFLASSSQVKKITDAKKEN